MSSTTNPPASYDAAPDPHGHAALLLVESLLHGLVARSLLTVQDAIEFLEVARDAQVEMAEAGRSPTSSTELLDALLRSMALDLRP